jgi:hypothetical protein
MNIATKNMNKMNTDIVSSKNIKVIEIQRERGTRIIPNHALDNVKNPSEACLPPSRPSLTSYALEYGEALRKINVSVFSNDLMPQGDRAWLYSPKLAT